MQISKFYFQVHSPSPQKLLEHALFAVKQRKGAKFAGMWIGSVQEERDVETGGRAAGAWPLTRNLRHVETSPWSGNSAAPGRMERGGRGTLASRDQVTV